MMKRGIFNVAEGAPRSGKTVDTLIMFFYWVLSFDNSRQYEFLMTGRSVNTIKRNLIEGEFGVLKLFPMFDFCEKSGNETLTYKNKKIHLIGAGDIGAYSRINGMTVAGHYADEVNFCPEIVLRCCIERSKSFRIHKANFWTLNPCAPGHLIYRKFIDFWRIKTPDLINYCHFQMLDNPIFTQEDEDMERRTKSTRDFNILVKGLRGNPEGLIYRDMKPEYVLDYFDARQIVYAVIGMDFGKTKSHNAFCLLGFTSSFREVIVLDEYYSSGMINLPKLQEDYIECLTRWRIQYPNLCIAFGDSAEPMIIRSLQLCSSIKIENSRKNSITDRILWLNQLMATNRFRILKRCKNTIRAIESASYDDKGDRKDNGTNNIDSLDALEYAFEPYVKKLVI